MIRMLGGVTILGAILWLLSEVIERANGGISQLSMAILIGALFTLAVGVWGIHGAQMHKDGRLSLIGAIGISLGSLLLGIVDVIGWGEPTIADVILTK